MSKKFVRRDSVRYLKLGKRRKKARVWRKPKGRDNKMRLKRKGYPRKVSIGFKSPKSKKPSSVFVRNLRELNKLSKNAVIILARVGAKKKLELMKRAQENNIKILNMGGKK